MSTIGFDTSNYTTSTAWTDGKTDINVADRFYTSKTVKEEYVKVTAFFSI